MRRDIVAIANKLIPQPSGIERVQDRYVTNDIIKQVLLQFEKHKNQLKEFAPYLKGETAEDTCRNIWKFWHDNIRYVADDAGNWKQLVKSPAAVWADKFCDCKSFSVAVAICCYQLGIKCVFRFVSFNQEAKTIPTHVYNVAYYQGRKFIIDCCLPEFNMEKNFAAKYDYLAPGLYAVNGVGPVMDKVRKFRNAKKIEAVRNNTGNPHKKRGCLCLHGVQSEAELELLIRKQTLELEQMRNARLHGIGSIQDNAYEIELAAINNAIHEIANPELKKYFGNRQLIPAAGYIGSPEEREFIAGKKAKEKKVAKKTTKEAKKLEQAKKKNEAGKAINKKDAKRLEKVNIVVNKKKEGILKKVAKVVTAPFRLIAKGAIELFLPKSAPVFLYLFLDEKVLPKAPAIVKAKRDRAVKIADRIVNKIGMKRPHFMQILRNGILANLGDTPENVIAQWVRDANYQLGLLPALATAGKFLGDLVMKVGAGKIEDLQNNAPDPSDWITETSQQRNDFANMVDQGTGGNQVPTQTTDSMYSQATGGGFDYSGGSSYGDDYTKEPYSENEFGSGAFGQQNYDGKTLEPAIVTAKKTNEDAPDMDPAADSPEDNPDGGGGSGLLIGAIVIGVLAFSK